MSIEITCPKCDHVTVIDVANAKDVHSCPVCGETLPNPPKKSKGLRNCGCALLLLIFVFLMLPAVETARPAAQRMQCTNNIKQLLLAIHSYHDTYQALPPASGPIGTKPVNDPEVYAPDASEWSWRVRILPFNEGQSLYDAFNFNEPWDSEHNLTLAENLPCGLQCPSDRNSTPNDVKMINGHPIPLTNYVMITGPGTIGSPGENPLTLDDVKDGTDQTIMIVEVFGENRPAWTEPVDITLEDLARGINAESGMSIGSRHPGGANVGFCDGSVHFFSEEIEIDLRRFGLIDDGKIDDWN